MKQVCLLCARTSPDRNLFCQETYCPAEMSPTILDYGEWLGDIEIVKPVIVLRSSVLYEATHQRQKVYLKVAHPGREHKERLKREAEFLQRLRLGKAQEPTLPRLLPPYENTTVAHDAYGKTMLQGHLLYFYLFEYFEGEPLRDLLIKNPQLWINHVGWIISSLAVTLNYLHLNGLFHYGLSPDCLLVRFDENPSVPRILLFDLGVACDKESLGQSWYASCVPPAYTAPELAGGNGHVPADYRADVYGLGLVLYEMLVGEPTFSYKLRSDAEVYEAVRAGQRVKMTRVEDVEQVAQLARRAASGDSALRPAFAADVAEQLQGLFGKVPPEKKRRGPSLQTVFVTIATVLAVAFLIALAVSLAA